FSECERFLDTPVKRYSSGMYVRLAFAVAAHLEPDVLLVDEVLSVGDLAFQRKCLNYMGNLTRRGLTIFLVSHNIAAIQSSCHRVLFIEGGYLRGDGKPIHVIEQYRDSIRNEEEARVTTYKSMTASSDELVSITGFEMVGED